MGLRLSVKRLREPDAMALLEARGVEQVWRRSIAEALAVIDLLDQRIAPLEVELATLAPSAWPPSLSPMPIPSPRTR